jgi:hypothetical protein
MNGPDPYEAWNKMRSEVEPDPGFTDRVMEAVRACERQQSDAEPAYHGAFHFAFHFAAAAALLFASLVVTVLRIESVAALILLFSSEGF